MMQRGPHTLTHTHTCHAHPSHHKHVSTLQLMPTAYETISYGNEYCRCFGGEGQPLAALPRCRVQSYKCCLFPHSRYKFNFWGWKQQTSSMQCKDTLFLYICLFYSCLAFLLYFFFLVHRDQ